MNVGDVASRIRALGPGEFDAAIQQAQPVLVKFTADWCGPCKAMQPVLEEIAVEHEDRLTVAAVDVDECPDVASRYGIQGVPHLILFSGGEIIARMAGARPKNELVSVLAQVL